MEWASQMAPCGAGSPAGACMVHAAAGASTTSRLALSSYRGWVVPQRVLLRNGHCCNSRIAGGMSVLPALLRASLRAAARLRLLSAERLGCHPRQRHRLCAPLCALLHPGSGLGVRLRFRCAWPSVQRSHTRPSAARRICISRQLRATTTAVAFWLPMLPRPAPCPCSTAPSGTSSLRLTMCCR